MSIFLITFLVIVFRFNFATVPELEYQPVPVNCYAFNYVQPKPLVKVLHRLIQLPQSEHESADGVSLCHPLGALLLQLLDPGLCFFIPFYQPVVPGEVFILILCHAAVFVDAALDQLHHDFQLLQQLPCLLVDVAAVGQLCLHQPAILDQPIPVRQKLAVCFEEFRLDIFLRQVRSAAFVFTFELVIALPDYPAILVRAVPDLRAEVMTAIAADQPGGKDAFAAVAPAQRFSPGDLLLHPIKQERVDDRLMAVFYVILRDLSLIDLHPTLDEIYRKFLL